MESTVVLIDGAYLNKICKHFAEKGQKHFKIDINQFAYNMAKNANLWCKEVYYYIAPPFQSEPPTLEEVERKRNYDRFINKMKNIKNFNIREGRCQYVDNEFHQKGVDTLITMDLFSVCFDDEIKRIVLLACDTDFVPIIKKLKKEGIEVILYYFSDFVRGSKFSMSNYIINECNISVLITKELIMKNKYIKKEL